MAEECARQGEQREQRPRMSMAGSRNIREAIVAQGDEERRGCRERSGR